MWDSPLGTGGFIWADMDGQQQRWYWKEIEMKLNFWHNVHVSGA